MKISDLMTERIVSVDKDEPVVAAARLLKKHNVGALPVTDREKRLRGIVTDRDIVLRCVAGELDPGATPVGEIMTRGIVTAEGADLVDDAVRAMSRDQVRRLPVVENGRLIGMLSLCDLSRSPGCAMEAAEALTEISLNLRRK